MCTVRARACTLAFFFFFCEFPPLVLFRLAMPPLKRTHRQFLRPRSAKRRRVTVRKPMPVRLVRAKPKRTYGPKKRGIVPDKRIVTMRYAVQYAVTVDPTFQTFSLRANGLFDPEVNIGGHQPRGFDQFMALYVNWVVLSSNITVKSWTRSGNEPCMVSIVVRKSGAAGDTSMVESLERNPRTTRTGSWRANGGGHRGGFVKASVNIAKFLNRTRLQDDFDLHGSSASDPNEEVYFDVNHTDAGTTSVGITDVIVVVSYRVMLLNPIPQLIS